MGTYKDAIPLEEGEKCLNEDSYFMTTFFLSFHRSSSCLLVSMLLGIIP